ncbi:hypothetical protein [Nesterenkonia pannonica]|uniref:hypothetical protein n=1 Tax=Nesterenkonia pannonica TaxID=1548602 RepID=UPI0021644DBA|nr:hypothetical protein [Nesterenkonia pannonica]
MRHETLDEDAEFEADESAEGAEVVLRLQEALCAGIAEAVLLRQTHWVSREGVKGFDEAGELLDLQVGGREPLGVVGLVRLGAGLAPPMALQAGCVLSEGAEVLGPIRQRA